MASLSILHQVCSLFLDLVTSLNALSGSLLLIISASKLRKGKIGLVKADLCFGGNVESEAKEPGSQCTRAKGHHTCNENIFHFIFIHNIHNTYQISYNKFTDNRCLPVYKTTLAYQNLIFSVLKISLI